MKHYLKNPLVVSLVLFIISLPIGTKKFLFEAPTNLPRFQEFSSVFLFLTDITAVVFLLTFLFSKNTKNVQRNTPKAQPLLFGFLFLTLLTVFHTFLSFPSLFLYARLFLTASVGLCVATLLSNQTISFKFIATTIAGTAIFEGLVGIFQFIFQRSIGLGFLGEPIITDTTKGVGRVLVDGGQLLRSQGTFVHANIYAAFLVFGLAMLYYLFLSEPIKKISVKRVVLGVGMLILCLGLLFSFSRSGWIGTALMTFFVGVLGVWIKEMRVPILLLLARLFVIGALLVSTFGYLAFPRANIPINTDLSFQYRVHYNAIGIRTIIAQPLGVGLGNQVAFDVKRGFYADEGITAKEPWNWQPVHNLFILVGGEAGLPALMVFLAFLLYLGWNAWTALRRARGSFPSELVIILPLFISFLVMAMADHYFWDLQSGRLMFWLVLGIMMGLSPRRSMDRISPSEGGDGRSNRPEGTV